MFCDIRYNYMTIKVHTCTLHVRESQAVYVEHYMLPVKIETWVRNWLNEALAEFFFMENKMIYHY